MASFGRGRPVPFGTGAMPAAPDAEYAPLMDDDDSPEVGGRGPAPPPGGGPVLLGQPVARSSVGGEGAQKPAAAEGWPAGAQEEAPVAPPAEATLPQAHLPVMLPGTAVLQPSWPAKIASTISRYTRGASSGEAQAQWILVPGPGGQPMVAPGEGAVCAGPQHAPHGSMGAAVGAGVGLLFGLGGLLVLPGVGYVAVKNFKRAQHVVRMADEAGRPVTVKLWKPGKHAPLTEEGYWLVASDPRDSETEIFIRRVLSSMGGYVEDPQALHAFVPRHSGRLGISSLARLREDLSSAAWVRFF